MKPLFLLLLFLSFFLFSNHISAKKQEQELIDSLLAELQKTDNENSRLNIFVEILYMHSFFKAEEGLKYETQALELAKKLGKPGGIARVKIQIGRVYWRLGKFEEALKNHFEALKIYEHSDDKEFVASIIMVIGQDYADYGKYPEAIKYFRQAINICEETGNKDMQATIYLLLSWVNNNLGNYAESSKHNYEALKVYEELGDKYSASIAMSNIAEDNIMLGNYPEALKYYERSIKPKEEANDKANLSSTYTGIGDIHKLMGNYNEALKKYTIALNYGKETNNNFSMAKSYQKIGDLFKIQGNNFEALTNYLLSAEIYKAVFNKQELAGVYNKIGICYTLLHDYTEANKFFEKEHLISKELDSKIIITEYYRGREFLDSTTGNWKNAYFNHKNYISNRDSIFSQENTKKLVQTQMQFEADKNDAIEKSEQEKKDIRQRNIRYSISAGLIGAIIFLVVVFRQRNKISKAKKRSDELLLNILPEETAEELKITGTTTAKAHSDVTVMFTDFKNFTNVSENLSAQELVNEINYCYSAFDKIITKYGIEKIKTIGDSYMCASGLPAEKSTHGIDAVNAAHEILSFVELEKQKRIQSGLPFFEIRIGLHSGPVVAGIVGIKKFAYDIWGDTVNIASRMESSGEVGKVNISETTFQLVKDKFTCIHRGKIQAKNKGEIDMYFVNPS